jgi:hypothetical protein
MKTGTFHFAVMASLLVLWLVPSGAPAAAPTGSAMTEAARWTAAKFGGVAETPQHAGHVFHRLFRCATQGPRL